MKKQTVEEFLASGGIITICKPGSKSKTSSVREFIKRDPRLFELNKLRSQLEDGTSAAEQVDIAIQKRYDILKSAW